MAAMFGRQQFQCRIRCERRMIVDAKRNQRIVLSHNRQGWCPDGVKKVYGGLGGVVIRGGTESKQRGRKFIVELPDCFNAFQVFGGVCFRRDAAFSSDAVFQAADEAPGIDKIGGTVYFPNAFGQVDRRGDSADTGQQTCFTQFSRHFQRNVAA